MEKGIQKIYMICLVVLVLLCLFSIFTVRLDVFRRQNEEGCQKITSYVMERIEDSQEPAGVREIYTLNSIQDFTHYKHLFFYSIHQRVDVYAGEECIYSMREKSSNEFGKTPGCVWNDILIRDEYQGRTLRIEITPVYPKMSGSVPNFYIGTKGSMLQMILQRDAFSVVLSVIVMIAGIVMILFVLYNYRNSEIDKMVAMWGAFALQMGNWKLFDTSLAKYIWAGKPAVSMYPFVALLLAPLPFVVFFRELLHSKDDKNWDVLCIGIIIVDVVIFLLQFFNLFDFKQSFVFNLALVLISIIVMTKELLKEFRNYGLSKRLRRNILFLTLCTVGIGADICGYYFSNYQKSSPYGMLALMAYVIAEALRTYREAKSLTIVGNRSKSYENMAYHDQMTGLYNRAALAIDTDRYTFDPSHCAVILFDLNDLKKCNDELGHDKGDIYIRDSADLIAAYCKNIGKVYRTGGDEFLCICDGVSLRECKKVIAELKTACQYYNRTKKQIQMSIACGYASYDGRMDVDIQQTIKRADKMMYEDKKKMKQAEKQA